MTTALHVPALRRDGRDIELLLGERILGGFYRPNWSDLGERAWCVLIGRCSVSLMDQSLRAHWSNRDPLNLLLELAYQAPRRQGRKRWAYQVRFGLRKTQLYDDAELRSAMEEEHER